MEIGALQVEEVVMLQEVLEATGADTMEVVATGVVKESVQNSLVGVTRHAPPTDPLFRSHFYYKIRVYRGLLEGGDTSSPPVNFKHLSKNKVQLVNSPLVSSRTLMTEAQAAGSTGEQGGDLSSVNTGLHLSGVV